MKKEFVRKNAFGVYANEQTKQRNDEIQKIAFALNNALCVIDEEDEDETLLNVARLMYYFGCRFKGNDNDNE